MKRRLSNLCSLVILSLLTACQDYDFGYKSYEPDTNETKYSRRFANRDDVNVNITTETPGAPYFVYFSNPYNSDGSFNGATAYLQGITPIRTKLSVPRHVDSLYVVSPMREMRVLAAGDVRIEDKNLFQPVGVTRVNIQEKPYEVPDGTNSIVYINENINAVVSNPDITDAVKNYANSCFPDNHKNIPEESRTKNTDLTFTSENEDDYVAVWVTLLGKGKNDPTGKVWFYIYPSENQNPEYKEVTFFGMDNGIVKQLSTSDQPAMNPNGYPSNKYPLFEANSEAQEPSTIFIGYVKSGYNIGFCYMPAKEQGIKNIRLRFTTPSLNAQASQGSKISDGTIVHQSLEVNGTMHEFNFLGFENQAKSPSDDDYNDMLLLIETNPEIRPKEEIEIETVITKTTTQGYYLFEDLYGNADKNDNDFNDAVLYYEKSIYNLGTANAPQWMCDFTAELLAYACVNTNTIGVYHNSHAFQLYEGITGEKNMEIAPVFDGSGKVKISFSLSGENDVILPYLRTTNTADGETTEFDPADPNKFNIYPTTYASKEFPYAMEIPFVEKNPFRWMQEGVIITDGYSNWNTDSWYTNPTDESQLVPRAEGSTY